MIGTEFRITDLSQINEINNVEVQDDVAPLTISCAPTEKGPEDVMVVSGNTYRELFGAPNYKRYGQISIQNQAVIDAKGKILFKRLVADDATLASATVVAKVYESDEGQKQDINGNPLYQEKVYGLNKEGEEVVVDFKETTNATSSTKEGEANDPITISGTNIIYEVEYFNPESESDVCKTFDDAYDNAAKLFKTVENDNGTVSVQGVEETVFRNKVAEDGTVTQEEEKHEVYTFPLFTITDNGRGASNKLFYIEPENSLSKNLPFMFYTINILEGGNIIDDVRFSILPNKIYNNECIDIDSASETYLTQVQIKSYPDAVSAFINKIADISGLEVDYLEENDILFGCNRKGNSIGGIVVDDINGIDMQNTLGNSLMGGQNGSFGINPAENEDAVKIINQKTLEFFSGTGNYVDKDEIYNLDVYQIDACFDANFDIPTKEAIAKLADYRKDFMYFRDFGNKCKSLEDVKDYVYDLTQSTWVTNYCQAYDIMDPYTLKKENVTIMYDIAPMMIKHMYSGRHKPFAGILNNAIISSITDKKTLNFAPKKLPDINEKDEMEDINVNFASYYGSDLVLETLFTSQEDYTQLSFSNNVMAVQDVIKHLRAYFPAARYQYITSIDDIAAIQTQINDYLSVFAGNFSELRCEYVEDRKYLQNKIFRCALYFRFNEFTQGELVDAYMLPSNII